ncbi:hypothetical protein BJV78DRAFT_413472 [Lactifluus subvellereus]|nr:hypothetical protein BJV78DRAFT_413472 [Lactifluus subvellereus]
MLAASPLIACITSRMALEPLVALSMRPLRLHHDRVASRSLEKVAHLHLHRLLPHPPNPGPRPTGLSKPRCDTLKKAGLCCPPLQALSSHHPNSWCASPTWKRRILRVA